MKDVACERSSYLFSDVISSHNLCHSHPLPLGDFVKSRFFGLFRLFSSSNANFRPLQLSEWDLRTSRVPVNKTEFRATLTLRTKATAAIVVLRA